ncbi:MAG: ABC transporter permease [Candidatus Bathyarchaeota archaeon]|jgi:ABC-type dipeptide/oligopeptide/nickel transport system permease component|nr:ABC transporter permease [Candidatus Bathyarchaeota archaeon]
MAGITKYIIRRFLFMIPVFLGVSILTFTISNAAGDPLAILRQGLKSVSPQVIASLRAYYHLDQPLYVRYFYWLWDILHLNLGVSASGTPVADKIGPWVFTTLELQIPALLLAVLIGIPLGVYSARHPYSKGDVAVTGFALFGYSMPTFWLGLMMIIIFSLYLGWLPSAGAAGITRLWWGSELGDRLAHLLMPLLVLTYVQLATFVRLIRGNMLQTLRDDYVLAARACGLSERTVVYKHALRNAITPIVTIVGLSFGSSLAGAPGLETTFSWPGLGYQFVVATYSLDIPMIVGITVVITVMLMVANLITDLVYGMIDPRIRLG